MDMALPILQLPNGRRVNQAPAIMRYLGAKLGYYPTDLEQAYQVDKICEDFYDIIGEIAAPTLMPKDQQSKHLATLFG